MRVQIPCRMGLSEDAPRVPVSLAVCDEPNVAEVSIHIDMMFPHGPVSMETLFRRLDLEEFVRGLTSFAQQPDGHLHLPCWDGVNGLRLYVVDPEARVVAMSGAFNQYLVSGDSPRSMGSAEKARWALSIWFEAMVMPRESVVELARFLSQCVTVA